MLSRFQVFKVCFAFMGVVFLVLNSEEFWRFLELELLFEVSRDFIV